LQSLAAAGDAFQKTSVDEAYLELSSLSSFDAAVERARRLKADIVSREGLTASVGIGPNKLVAKIASDFQKPERIGGSKAGQIVAEEEQGHPECLVGIEELRWDGRTLRKAEELFPELPRPRDGRTVDGTVARPALRGRDCPGRGRRVAHQARVTPAISFGRGLRPRLKRRPPSSAMTQAGGRSKGHFGSNLVPTHADSGHAATP
jgi:hypothetical protein